MIAKRKIARVIAIIVAIILAVGLLFLFAYIEEVTKRNLTWLLYLTLFLGEICIEVFFPEVDKKTLIKKHLNKRYESMLIETFNSIVGNEVEIKTLDEYVSGVLKAIDGDFLIVEHQKKKSVETIFVNKNSIETIKLTKQK